jgi:hypothetical protein
VSIIRYVRHECNACGALSDPSDSAEAAWETLRRVGWRNRDNGHLCPNCSAHRPLADYLPGAPKGLCNCGCGEATPIAPRSRTRAGWVKGEPMPKIPSHRTPAPLLDPVTGCLIWMGRMENGYGRHGAAGAHVVAWEKANGRKVPKGYEVHHKCVNPPCVNASHLDAIPAWQNRALVGKLPKPSSLRVHLP